MRISRVVACLLVALAIHFVYRNGAFAMTSTNYQVNWDSVNSGGTDVGTSTNYSLRDTVGEQATGFSTSTNYTVSAGYRTGDEAGMALSFQIGTIEDSTEQAYSSYNTTTKQIVVTNGAAFLVDDFIAVVENKGLNQKISFGKIRTINVNTIIVDRWDGDQDSVGGAPSGGDDFVYRMNGNSVAFGQLSSVSAKTSMTGTRVSSDAQNGYTVYVSEDGNLRNGTSTHILDVVDGQVTVGSEEYGWRVFGDKATNTGSDFAFSTSTTAIQNSASRTLDYEGVGLVYKISIAQFTPAGSYSHIVQYTITPNY